MERVYLDHAATSPLRDECRNLLLELLDGPFGNASSQHAEGRLARGVLDEARERLAAALRVDADEIVFCASGTEADNMALRGRAWLRRGSRLAISAVEHEAGSRTMFDQMDADKDGSLTEAEIKAGHEAKMESESKSY